MKVSIDTSVGVGNYFAVSGKRGRELGEDHSSAASMLNKHLDNIKLDFA